MRLSFIAIGGVILSWIVVGSGVALAGVGLAPYISISSMFITMGGTFATLIIAAPRGFIWNIILYFRVALSQRVLNKMEDIELLVEFSERARKDGLLALEDILVDIENVYMRKGIQMVIDGTDPDTIKRTLVIEQEEVQNRHEQVQNTFGYLEKVAPAFGLIGTIIGLVALLGNIGGDPASIGIGLQTALITTLYGSLLANMILAPVRNKLIEMDVDELCLHNIVLEGVLGIQSGDNPRILKDRLLSFLSSEEKEKMLLKEE